VADLDPDLEKALADLFDQVRALLVEHERLLTINQHQEVTIRALLSALADAGNEHAQHALAQLEGREADEQG
jgi:hypothetical protein